ncbi:MAG: heavy-metal-associated domain-containing protein [Pyrinomonadaceae bacterium]|nr:heavy-metal-associated domain-containing protein [Pyrinomonadaceae bacterium]
MIEQEQNGTGARRRGANRVAFAGAAVLVLATIAGVSALIVRAQRTGDAATSTSAVKTERVIVGIEGMHCGSCASGIKAMLKRTPGVVSAEVNFESKEANVEYDPAGTSREKIVEAITNMGYKASVKV